MRQLGSAVLLVCLVFCVPATATELRILASVEDGPRRPVPALAGARVMGSVWSPSTRAVCDAAGVQRRRKGMRRGALSLAAAATVALIGAANAHASCIFQKPSSPFCFFTSHAAIAVGIARLWNDSGWFFHTNRTLLPYSFSICAKVGSIRLQNGHW